MDPKIFAIIDKVECSTAFLGCSINAIRLIHETLEHELILQSKSSGDVGYCLQLCSAMVPAIRELDRTNEELNAVIAAAYQKKKGE